MSGKNRLGMILLLVNLFLGGALVTGYAFLAVEKNGWYWVAAALWLFFSGFTGVTVWYRVQTERAQARLEEIERHIRQLEEIKRAAGGRP